MVVKKFAGRTWYNATLWFCKCDCGNEKIIQGSNLQNRNIQSCGCLQQEKRKERIGEKAPNYIDGKYTRTVFKLKEKIRKRDNYTCQKCGITQEQHLKETSKKLSVHHIDGDDSNNVEENMITLCIKCHNKIGKTK